MKKLVIITMMVLVGLALIGALASSGSKPSYSQKIEQCMNEGVSNSQLNDCADSK